MPRIHGLRFPRILRGIACATSINLHACAVSGKFSTNRDVSEFHGLTLMLAYTTSRPSGIPGCNYAIFTPISDVTSRNLRVIFLFQNMHHVYGHLYHVPQILPGYFNGGMYHLFLIMKLLIRGFWFCSSRFSAPDTVRKLDQSNCSHATRGGLPRTQTVSLLSRR